MGGSANSSFDLSQLSGLFDGSSGAAAPDGAEEGAVAKYAVPGLAAMIGFYLGNNIPLVGGVGLGTALAAAFGGVAYLFRGQFGGLTSIFQSSANAGGEHNMSGPGLHEGPA